MAYTTIDNPELYFQTKLYTGQASSQGDGTTTAITFDGDEDMQPDLIWIKNRDGTDWHDVTDSVRGVTKSIYPNENDAEDTVATAVTAIGSDGFTVGSNDQVNDASDKYVAWCWKESATAGFDIVSYTGNATNRTISHSLSAAAKVVIIKDRSTTGEWVFGHGSQGFTKFAEMNSTGAFQTVASRFNNTAPTSSVFSVGTANDTNENTDSLIAYLFAEKQGFSKFGSYTGNGNADGAFIYTGFRPAWIMFKNTSQTQNWYMYDNKRSSFNPANDHFYADADSAEVADSAHGLDILSNGFKMRTTNDGWNGSGEVYVYIAFAEAPFVNSKGVPCNAR